jgi:hypothetical protein
MTNDEMRNILERGLGIPVKESDAAWILAVVEERLRNEPATQHSVQSDQPKAHTEWCASWETGLLCNCGAGGLAGL